MVAPPSLRRRENASMSSCLKTTSPGSQGSLLTGLSSGPLSVPFLRTVTLTSTSTGSSTSTSTPSTTTTNHPIPNERHTSKKTVSFNDECTVTEYTLELTPEQRSSMWWDAVELDHFRSKRKRRRQIHPVPALPCPNLPPMSSSFFPLRRRREDRDGTESWPHTKGGDPEPSSSPSSVVDDRRHVPDLRRSPPSPPPPRTAADPPHCSHPRQVVYVYRVYKDDDGAAAAVDNKEEKETSSELVREFSRRSSKQARDKAHHRAVVLAQSMASYLAVTARKNTSSHPPRHERSSQSTSSSSSSASGTYPLLQNRFFGLSSRLTDVYLESLLETIERNWLCGGGTAGNTAGAGSGTSTTSWGMEDSAVAVA